MLDSGRTGTETAFHILARDAPRPTTLRNTAYGSECPKAPNCRHLGSQG